MPEQAATSNPMPPDSLTITATKPLAAMTAKEVMDWIDDIKAASAKKMNTLRAYARALSE